MDWLEDALCKGINNDFFYPPLEAPNHNHYFAVGKYVCYSCPVWQECLDYGTSNEEVWGMWGGITPQERKKKWILKHGSIESKRVGCRCTLCLGAPLMEAQQPDLESLPKHHQEYDLTTLVFDITRGK